MTPSDLSFLKSDTDLLAVRREAFKRGAKMFQAAWAEDTTLDAAAKLAYPDPSPKYREVVVNGSRIRFVDGQFQYLSGVNTWLPLPILTIQPETVRALNVLLDNPFDSREGQHE